MKVFVSLLLLLSLLHATTLYVGESLSKVHTTQAKDKYYSVRFISFAKNLSKQQMMNYIPQKLKKHTYLMKSGDYITAMYQKRASHKKILQDLAMIEKIGYKDAYIRSYKRVYKKHRTTPLNKTTKQVPKLSQYDISNLISKANKAYNEGDYMQSIIYYEMLLSSGLATQKMKKNLCYLYGHIGAYLQAKEIIDHSHYPAQFIYAYAYGAATAGKKSYYNNLKPYIAFDRTGRLSLLTGYYFEHQKNTRRAYTFYKMAYEKNPSDNYNLYAYARAQDIANKKKEAYLLYKELLRRISPNSPLYKNTQQRVLQLGGHNE